MFSKSKINDPIDTPNAAKPATPAPTTGTGMPDRPRPRVDAPSTQPRVAGKSAPSVIASDLRVVGNLITEGDLQIEGTVDGDIDANVLIIGQGAQINGEVRAADVAVNGGVKGRIRGTKVRLSETAHVDGDIVHASISIEAGAHFEGSIHRDENPLKDSPASSSKIMELNTPPKTGGAA